MDEQRKPAFLHARGRTISGSQTTGSGASAALGGYKQGRAIELDAIRGLAISLVLLFHLQKPTGTFIDILLWPGMKLGWVGVDIFFVLSGFLIGGLILDEIDRTKSFNVSRFLVRRAFRLWPVLYLFVLVQIFRGAFSPSQFVPQIFFHVQNYFATPFLHLWSLAVEEQFYFCAALILPFLARKHLSDRALLGAMVAIALTSEALRVWAWSSGWSQWSLQWQSQFRADVLAAGIALAIIRLRRPDWWEALQLHRALWLCGALLAAIGLGISAAQAWPPAISSYFFGLALGVCLIVGLEGCGRSWMRPLAFMGIYSYSIYIWHIGLGRTVSAKAGAIAGPLLGSVTGYIAVIVAGVIIAKLVEKPMMQLRNRMFPTANKLYA